MAATKRVACTCDESNLLLLLLIKDFAVSMYLRQAWHDPRLAFESFGTGIEKIRFGKKIFKKLWVPDTFFRNEKEADFHDVTVDNRLLTVDAKGNVWYVIK